MISTASIEEKIAAIEAWITTVITDRSQLLKVVLDNNFSGSAPTLCAQHLQSHFNFSLQDVGAEIERFGVVLEAMLTQGIIVDGNTSAACEWRRRLLNWYETKSVEEKQLIPIAANTIKKRGYLDDIPELAGYSSARSYHLLVRNTFEEILEDLTELGVMDKNYKTVKERADSKVEVENKASLYQRFGELRSVLIVGASDIARPTEEEPYLHLLHVFAAASMASNSKSGQSNYVEAYKYVRECFLAVGFTGSEELRELFTPYTLVRFREYLQERIVERKMSTSHGTGLLSAARITMRRACEIKDFGLDSFIPALGFSVERETDAYKPYSAAERNRISEVISREIEETNKLAQPYVFSNVGIDPLGADGKVRKGFATLDNARWIFENILDGQTIGYDTCDPDNKYQVAMLRILSKSELSIGDVYEQWGVLYQVDSRVLAPYISRLAQITGLNADSLLSLELEDFVERHDLTGRPCLIYWKERSHGEKMYPLDLFDADISWLTTSQGEGVKKIFDDVKYLTRNIRLEAPDSARKKLFIYKSSAPKMLGAVSSFEASIGLITQVCARMVRDHNILSDKGEALVLSASRFRPSFVSELIERGVSIREIQVMLGHQSIATTIAYLDRMDFNYMARKVLDKALQEIHGATLDEKPQLIPVTNVPANTESVVINTGLVNCKNVMDPPDIIKGLKSYKPGTPCSLLNKCLSCSNSIISVSHLPELFAMRRDYKRMIESNRVLDTPYGEVILDNLSVLSSILDVETSDFTEEELSQAERYAENVSTNILVEGVML